MNFQAAMGIQESWVWISRCVDFNGLCRGNEENLKQIFRSSHPSVFYVLCFSCLISRTCSTVFLCFHLCLIAIAVFPFVSSDFVISVFLPFLLYCSDLKNILAE